MVKWESEIKIISLLQRIADGDENLPNEIEFEGDTYYREGLSYRGRRGNLFNNIINCSQSKLNCKVKITESFEDVTVLQDIIESDFGIKISIKDLYDCFHHMESIYSSVDRSISILYRHYIDRIPYSKLAKQYKLGQVRVRQLSDIGLDKLKAIIKVRFNLR